MGVEDGRGRVGRREAFLQNRASCASYLTWHCLLVGASVVFFIFCSVAIFFSVLYFVFIFCVILSFTSTLFVLLFSLPDFRPTFSFPYFILVCHFLALLYAFTYFVPRLFILHSVPFFFLALFVIAFSSFFLQPVLCFLLYHCLTFSLSLSLCDCPPSASSPASPDTARKREKDEKKGKTEESERGMEVLKKIRGKEKGRSSFVMSPFLLRVEIQKINRR